MLEIIETESIELSNDLLDELKSFIESEEIKQLDIEVESKMFKIQSPDQANYFITKLKEAEHEKEKIQLIAKKEKERLIANIKKWEDKEVAAQDYNINYISGLLEQFYNESNMNNKALKLPAGTISYRKQRDKYDYVDEKLAVKSLEEIKRNEYIRITPSLIKNDLKKDAIVKDNKLYIDDKEIEGIRIIKQEPKFTVK